MIAIHPSIVLEIRLINGKNISIQYLSIIDKYGYVESFDDATKVLDDLASKMKKVLDSTVEGNSQTEDLHQQQRS